MPLAASSIQLIDLTTFIIFSFSPFCWLIVESRVTPLLIALEERLLEVEYPAGSLVASWLTRSLTWLLSDAIWGCVSTDFYIRAWLEFLIASAHLIFQELLLWSDIIIVLRHLITDSINVVMEDKVVNLACIAWINSWHAGLQAWAL